MWVVCAEVSAGLELQILVGVTRVGDSYGSGFCLLCSRVLGSVIAYRRFPLPGVRLERLIGKTSSRGIWVEFLSMVSGRYECVASVSEGSGPSDGPSRVMKFQAFGPSDVHHQYQHSGDY
ncbi:hypothetical protein F2Q70_00031891 [Brassica cretica]|uniref:Uncharacterized protein n=1 Tax=Brassica cretica TaxID=69181 RepID=A0A8S9FQ97_BRACR|nr:hypothetical protein F2Q70_00031891 [Brassica cretica]